MRSHDAVTPIPSPGKTMENVETEWDLVAELRRDQLIGHRDLSFEHVLVPTVLELLGHCDARRVVDIGCGTGTLTDRLAANCGDVLGIDLSRRSIDLANSDYRNTENLSFVARSVEAFAAESDLPRFSVAVANMTLMDCLDLDSVLEAIFRLLESDGWLIATITHPCFWPRYWGYDKADWFSYEEEIIIESPFKISVEVSEFVTTHVHRPLSMYVNSLAQSGFWIDRLLEPLPNEQAQQMFPEPWDFPRFLAFKAGKIRKLAS